MSRILVADDDAGIRALLRELFEDEGYDVDEAANGTLVLEMLGGKDAPELVLMDVRMPDLTGLDVLRRLNDESSGSLPIIIMTAYGTANVAIEAIQLGAYDYVTKPFDLDDVLVTVRRYFEHKALAAEVAQLRSKTLERDPNTYMIGNSPAMQEVFKIIGRVARSEATVLITGETGTGKELVATTIHRTSPFAGGPLVKVNCAALPETLLESELFGHEKGAFTGAINQRKGRFEMAHKGTIFLDEIGEMTLATQKKLLRVLQEREFERVGGERPIRVDVRIVAATNKNLPDEIKEGNFREDLYYRLNVISIYMPPLREKPEDIPLLVEHFLDKHRFASRAGPARITPSAMRSLMEHEWPGNVRELENTIERAVVLAQGGVITEDHVLYSSADQRHFVDIGARVRSGRPLGDIMGEVERQILTEALRQAQGDRLGASTLLSIDLGTFNEKLAYYGMPGELSVSAN
jgi:two-component system response regulator AtoC